MMSYDRKNHWEDVYSRKTPQEVSWYQIEPVVSVELIRSTGIGYAGKIIDVGGGASVLVDHLFKEGYQNLTVLDISSKSLNYAKERLGRSAGDIFWIEADVTVFDPPQKYDLWHDRAVFHFLTDPKDQKKYVRNMERSLNPGGHLIIATFAIDGPIKCSGLNVERYDSRKLKGLLGAKFEFVKTIDEDHITPAQTKHKFMYAYFKKFDS